ncbi:hypothetical protein [Falsirhodobacter deserti]|nr:hypothetical protein [Falsirhodobacter deserti]
MAKKWKGEVLNVGPEKDTHVPHALEWKEFFRQLAAARCRITSTRT